MEFSILVIALSSCFFSQTGVDGLNIPELFTTLNGTVYIPCGVDTGTDHERMTPISWTRVGFDGFVQTLLAPNVVPPSNVGSIKLKLNKFSFLVVSNIVKSLSGTYTCHTDKGSASTLVHVLDGELPPIVSSIESPKSELPSCSENFDLVHGRCLYYSNVTKNWKDAHADCYLRTSSLITFKDVKDLMSFLLNIQNSGPAHYEFNMWTGHAYFEEENSRFGALHNDAQVAPMLYRHSEVARLSSCGKLPTVKFGIYPASAAECNSKKYNYLCEQPTL